MTLTLLDGQLELHGTDPPGGGEGPWLFTGRLTGPRAAGLTDGGSVLFYSPGTGWAAEVFLDPEGGFRQEMEPPGTGDLGEVTVYDPSGQVVAQARVAMTSETSGRERTAGPVALDPEWPRFVQLVRDCIFRAGTVARETGRSLDELLEHIHAQERYAEQAYRAHQASAYQECVANLTRYGTYLGRILQDAQAARQKGPADLPPDEAARAGLKAFRSQLAEVWKKARAAGRAELEPDLNALADRGKGLSQRIEPDPFGVVRDVRGLLLDLARVHERLEGSAPAR